MKDDDRNTLFFSDPSVAERIEEGVALVRRYQKEGHSPLAIRNAAHYAGRYYSEMDRARIKAEVLRRARL